MKAIGYLNSLPVDAPESLLDIELPQPVATGHDLLVKVQAIAVNPVDYKIRQNVAATEGQYKVLGWDAVGEVVATGELVSHFEPGDKVFYAGDLTRSGSNAEFQLVDERIVGKQPKSLSNAEAAALPLTAITAWELLFERLAVSLKSVSQKPTSEKLISENPAAQQTSANAAVANASKANEVLLVIGAAGGVGSILLQLAKSLTNATVIATASRESSKAWVTKLGADYVVDHTQPLAPQINELVAKESLGAVTHVASLNNTDKYLDDLVEVLAPMGKLGLIDDPQSLDISKLKLKSISLHWEFMFTRSMFQTQDMDYQHALLNRVADLVDEGVIQTTIGKNLGAINATNLKAAHAELEAGTAIGKIVLEGF